MSNTYVIHDARLVANPEVISTKTGKNFTKARVADNAPGPKDPKRPARFVTLKAWGGTGEALAKLVKTDVISAVGELELESYTDKSGVEKTADVMRVEKFRVQKSDAFFGRAEEIIDAATNPPPGVPVNPFA